MPKAGRALSTGRLAALGARGAFYHGLPGLSERSAIEESGDRFAVGGEPISLGLSDRKCERYGVRVRYITNPRVTPPWVYCPTMSPGGLIPIASVLEAGVGVGASSDS